jgi:hypothetical protein
MYARKGCVYRYGEDHKTFYDFGRLKSNTVHYRVHQFPSDIRRHANRVTRNNVHAGDPQIFGDTEQNLFSRAAVGRDLYRVLTWGRERFGFYEALHDYLFVFNITFMGPGVLNVFKHK